MGKSTNNEIIVSMWGDFDLRVSKICKFYDITKKEMAAKIGIASGRLSQLKEGAQHTIAYSILLAYPDINARWLLFGQEPMIAPAPIVAGSPQDTPEGRAAKLAAIQHINDAPAHHSAEYDRLLDKYTAVVVENTLLKEKMSNN